MHSLSFFGRRLLGCCGVVAAVGASVLAAPEAAAQVSPEFTPDVVESLFEGPLEPQFVPNEIIVKLRPVAGATVPLAAQDVTAFGLEVAPRRTSGDELVYTISLPTLLQLQTAEAVEQRITEIVAQLNQRPDVEYAQPNWILQPLDTAPNDTLYGTQWHYLNNGAGAGQSPGGIGLPASWDVQRGSAGVVVSVIDTGVPPAHPDIAGSPNLGTGYDMISSVAVANDGDGRDANPADPGDAVAAGECGPGTPARPSSWHGTHVAGTVGVGNTNNASGVAGMNWTVTLLPVRVLGKCGGSTADINDAIRWSAGLPVPGVPANANPARVINMSLGGGAPCSASPSTQSAINDAVAAGAVVVVAAGNSASDAANFLPASCDNVITVAASDARGHLVERYSNFGATIEIMAPGGDVRRDDNGDGEVDGVLSMVDGGYALYNGTSMAAPHVAGAAALHLAQNPAMTPTDVLNRLQADALPRDATQCPKPCGAGLLQVRLAPKPPEGAGIYEYAVKLVCGIQKDPKSMVLARGFYATTVNIHNPGPKPVTFEKKLALSIPPGEQKPGKVIRIAKDDLEVDQALATDCDDIARRVFDGSLPTPFIEGFVVIRSPQSLDVTAVYTTATLSADGTAGEHSSIHVEPIEGRKPEGGRNVDLRVRSIDNLSVSCPGGVGTCVTKADVTIENVGTDAAGPFTTRTVLDPAQSVIVDQPSGGLPPGPMSFPVTTPPGGNCFDPDCQVCATVDALDTVAETDETNNKLCTLSPG
jgi:serine protease